MKYILPLFLFIVAHAVAGAQLSIGDLNHPHDTLPPVFVHSQNCSGIVTGAVSDLPKDDSVRSNLNSLRLDSTSFNYTLSVTQFIPGLAQGTTFKLSPKDSTADARAILIAMDQAGNVSRDTVRYLAVRIDNAKPVLTFGKLNSGEAKYDTLTIRNYSDKPLILYSAAFRHGSPFKVLSPSGGYPFTLGDPTSGFLKIIVEVDTAAVGFFKDTLEVSDSCRSYIVAIATVVIEQPQVTVTGVDFGGVRIDSAGIRQRIFIKNTGGGTLIISGLRRSSDSMSFPFPDGRPAFPIMLAANEVANPALFFEPTEVRSYTDTLFFLTNVTNDGSNEITSVLHGVGLAPPSAVPADDIAETTFSVEPNVVSAGSVLLRYTLKAPSSLEIVLVASDGRESLISPLTVVEAGSHSQALPLDGFPSGTYHVRFTSNLGTVVRPLIIAR